MTPGDWVIVRRDPLALGIGQIERVLADDKLSVTFPEHGETWALHRHELETIAHWNAAADHILTDQDLQQLLA